MAEQRTECPNGCSNLPVATRPSRTAKSDVAFLAPHIKPSDHILSIDCGRGITTMALGALVPQGTVTGIDFSAEYLRLAREALAAAKERDAIIMPMPRIKFSRASPFTGLPFADASFDVVYSSRLFPYLVTGGMRTQALGEMRRVLKPGGVLAGHDNGALHIYPQAPQDLNSPRDLLNRLCADCMERAFRDADWDDGRRSFHGEDAASLREDTAATAHAAFAAATEYAVATHKDNNTARLYVGVLNVVAYTAFMYVQSWWLLSDGANYSIRFTD